MCCRLIVLVLSTDYYCYRVKMSKQILNREKVLEIFLRNPFLSKVDVSKLIGVTRSSVGIILRRLDLPKEERLNLPKEKQDVEKRKDLKINIKQNQSFIP